MHLHMIPRCFKKDDDGNLIAVHVSPTGRTEWVGYIPVQEVTDVAGKAYTYDNDGHIPVVLLTSTTGLVEWVDYTPVDIVTSRGSRWVVSSDGFIPVVDNTPP